MVVREHIGVIILAIFIVIAVFGPIACIVYSRRREHQKFHPSPNAFRQARKKLGTVAECRKGDEKGLTGDTEWTDNCPICIGSLTAEGTRGEDADEKAVTTTVTEKGDGKASGSKDAAGPEQVEGADDHPRGAGETSTAAGPPEDNAVATGARATEETEAPAQPGPEPLPIERLLTRLRLRKVDKAGLDRDSEILKLRSCGHWFHARCLSSWFLIDRYDCPVCRKSYWDAAPKRPGLAQWMQNNYNVSAARMGAGALV